MPAPKIEMTPTQFGIVILSLVLLALLALTAHVATPAPVRKKHFWLTFLIIWIGGCVGALLAAMVSPFSSSEDQAFRLVAGIAAAFLTGFVWKAFGERIQGSLGSLFPPTQEQGNGPGQARAAAFVVAVFMSAFLNYAFRVYASRTPNEEAVKQLHDIRVALDKLERSLPSEKHDPSQIPTTPRAPLCCCTSLSMCGDSGE
jgi:hypothetical protein